MEHRNDTNPMDGQRTHMPAAGAPHPGTGDAAQLSSAGPGTDKAGPRTDKTARDSSAVRNAAQDDNAGTGTTEPGAAAQHARRMKRGEVRPGSAWALVTGAGSGIGRCYALQLAALGYRLVIVGNNPAPLEAVAEEIRSTAAGRPSAGGKIHAAAQPDAGDMNAGNTAAEDTDTGGTNTGNTAAEDTDTGNTAAGDAATGNTAAEETDTGRTNTRNTAAG
ncbi:MAG: SDR family NAD(P)-dependent oxidoreductase, partial [Alistipes sp.]|nr:SDR family NAD(P)-dependent oxidoreductase [Alistipes sp.]